MAQSAGAPAEVVRGVVEQVNDKGAKIAGQWFNFSKFHQVAPPERGQAVELTVQRGFINALDIVGGDPGTGRRSAVPQRERAAVEAPPGDGDAFAGLPATPARVASVAQVPAPAAPQRATGPTNGNGRPPLTLDRETVIRRLALVKAAAEYAADQPGVTADDVVVIASAWESWVIEPA